MVRDEVFCEWLPIGMSDKLTRAEVWVEDSDDCRDGFRRRSETTGASGDRKYSLKPTISPMTITVGERDSPLVCSTIVPSVAIQTCC